MSRAPATGHSRLPTPTARQIDHVCDRFEDAWLAGRCPRIEEYLGEVPEPDRPALWRELMALDLDYRRRRGERPAAEDYAERFPEYRTLLGSLLDGQPPSVRDLDPATVKPAVQDSRWPTVSGYEIVGVLGQGAMGVVYKARQLRLNRLVALKMILTGGYTGERELARFRAEAEAVAQLHHPHVVQVYDVGEADGKPFFSMEFVEGGSLADRLETGPMRPHRAAQLVETVARAMHAAHRDGVVHRDLKPANILLAADGTPKVTDFGLAKQLDRDSSQTKSGTVLGTPCYMAPEQASGRAHVVGGSADVYALGAILYHALTGRPPFKGPSVLDTLEQVRSREAVRPRQLQPDVPRDLETVCLKCLEKDPRKRYADAAALADDLRAYLESRPIQARPVTLWDKSVKWAKRSPWVAFLCGLVLGVAALGAGLSYWQWREAQTEHLARDVEHQRALKLLFRLSMDRASDLCQQGEVARGMLWLTRALDISHDDSFPPEEVEALRRSVRANLGAWRGRLHALRHVLPHPAPVDTAIFSPNGRLAIAACSDYRVRLWHSATGSTAARPLEHPAAVLALCCSPNNGLILTGCADGGARLWDALSGRLVGAVLRAPKSTGPVRAVAFSPPDGKTLVTAGDDRVVRLWETATGTLLREGRGHQGAVQAVDYSPDGRAILTGSADRTARLWDAVTLKPGSVLNEDGEVWGVDFSPRGKLLLTLNRKQGAEPDSSVDLWAAVAGNSHIAKLHYESLTSAVFSPSGRKILTGGTDHYARLWDTDNGQRMSVSFQHGDAVLGVAFSPDGKTLLTGSQDHTARLWEEATGKPLGQPLEHQGPVQSVAFTPGGQTVLTASQDRTARLWEASPTSPSVQPQGSWGERGRVLTVGFSPDGLTMVSGNGNQLVLRRVADRNRLGSLRHEKDVLAVAFNPGGTAILTGSRDGLARLWDPASGRSLRSFEHRQPVRSVAFSPDGATILTASGDDKGGEIRLWDFSSGQPMGRPLSLPGTVWALAFSSDGKQCAASIGPNFVRVYDLTTRKQAELPSLHRSRVVSLAFSPDGRFLLTGSTDRTARLWDTATSRPIGSPLQHQGPVWAAAFSPDGQTVVTGGSDGNARVWDVASGAAVGPPWPHGDGGIWAVAFQPDGRFVFTGGGDGFTRLWEVPVAVGGSPELVRLWAEVITAMELDDEGVVHRLGATTWTQRRDRLRELGGSPAP
jgi:WD40 repeat protein/tRNA A-37 threonylcarbamoyl transferase component Bud32